MFKCHVSQWPSMKNVRRPSLLAGLVALSYDPALAESFNDRASEQPGLVRSEFVSESPPTPSSHASTIAETGSGLVAAWFGGTAERNPDVGIWISTRSRRGWSAPKEVANGEQDDGKRLPCWNPVLFQSKEKPLLLFYKIGASPATWWGMMMSSSDDGQTWSQPRQLPNRIFGPIKNKPVEFADGTLLCGSSTEHNGWRVHFEWTHDYGRTWVRTPAINDGAAFGVIQPGLLKMGDWAVEALMRSSRGQIYVSRLASRDGLWSRPEPTKLPNPDSGLDAVTLRDGRHLLVYNHTTQGRSPLNVAISTNGTDWQAAFVMESEPGEYSYPAVIQSDDGLVHITYTWKRQRIKHVALDPALFQLRNIVDGQWPE